MTFYRNTVWFMKGLKEYTKAGYETASAHFNAADLEGVDCAGRHYMVTGSNSGLGLSVATSVAAKGGTVHMVCRNVEAAEKAKEGIVAATGNDKVHVHHLDLSKTADVFTFAEKFSENPGKLDVLVNNAGCMINTRTVTEDGKLEKNFATNTLGTYCLTEALLPLIKSSSEGRVVTVSSGGMLVSRLDLSDLQSEKTFDGTMAYSQQKRHQVILSRLWSQQHPTVHWSSVHPGWADTPAVRSSMPGFHAKMGDRLRSTEQGADTIAWLALARPDPARASGLFWQDRAAVSEHLPLACTRAKEAEEAQLVEVLREMAEGYRS